MGDMSATVTAIFRHPVKGFTPEALDRVALEPDVGFPDDRTYAVENGPCGFDPAEPIFIPKQKFTVLAALPQVGLARTRFDNGRLTATAPGMAPFDGDLRDETGREAFAAWLTQMLGEDVRGPLTVIEAPASHRFTDNPLGQVSIVNLASVRDLSARMGVEVDPLRFRANLYVDGWPAWAENGWTGRTLSIGGIEAEMFKPIVRCAATHVHPDTAERDLDITRALFDNYGHMHTGIYVRVTRAGAVAVGDSCSTPSPSSEQDPA